MELEKNGYLIFIFTGMATSELAGPAPLHYPGFQPNLTPPTKKFGREVGSGGARIGHRNIYMYICLWYWGPTIYSQELVGPMNLPGRALR